MKPTDLEQVRAEFAEKLREVAGLKSPSLVRALATVPREHFVGPGPWKILRLPDLPSGYRLTPDDDPRHLYDNVLVALDADRFLNNGEPASLARWFDNLDLAPGDRFLHIGCGVGYYTAIATQAVLPGGRVVGIEIDPQLAERAKRNLATYGDVEVISMDGSEYEADPFDAIFVNAGATEVLPRWLDRPCAYTVEDANRRHEARRVAAGVPDDEEHLAGPHVHPWKRNGQRNEQTTTDA